MLALIIVGALMLCGYTDWQGVQCKHFAQKNSNRCVFHDTTADPKKFLRHFQVLVSKKDGNWRGFNFPDLDISHQKFDFDIDLSDSIFTNANITQVEFCGNIDLKRAKFQRRLSLSGTRFRGFVELQESTFEGKVESNSIIFSGYVNMSKIVARDDWQLGGKSESGINLNSSIFYKSAKFRGFRQVYMSTSGNNPPTEVNYLFMGESHIENVNFVEPEKVSFNMVDFRKCYLSGTNLIGCNMINVLWPKIKNRSGLFQEIWATEPFKTDITFRESYAPVLEHTYREIRRSYENNGDFITSNDFRIGEMQSKEIILNDRGERVTLFFVHFYGVICGYGTDIKQSVRVSSDLFVLYFITYFLADAATSTKSAVTLLSGAASNYLSILSLQGLAAANTEPALYAISCIMRLIMAILISLMIISFRSTVRR
ncbi:pentapeptide repeat-containing protein [Emcibacter sp. SYSU 3D8]|uniref:pentapeptide repeat-containing protein n=1 Tax=Emcibacter sp. SYSU 3D8 TaxID=3133969 RepID=UPI0031FE6BA1